ncbi:hypothetical protein Poly24_47100 [Rosistilla carotiformis]|uniref:Nickel uptake substrate-specific transmembrane region n=1 Tax=Rosistilla carotiformis TaxID=2528017 RepID=A0A518JZK3_9BACT|nr:carboxypeptidase-like regulatory domain-containing protein [Rosistilla carotiformis]QDV70977.1 hypothetical protein Poly24_47100 [Rosistilla carotiformis]
MKFRQTLQSFLVVWTCLGLSVPGVSFAHGKPESGQTEGAIPVAPRVQDVALHRDGTLQGAVVESNGKPIEDAPVVIGRFGKPIAELRTDSQGRFVVGGLEAGIYQVVTHGRAEHCRVWTPGTAPESAKLGVIHVADPEVARGAGNGRLHAVFCHPLFAFAVAAASVAIPIAIDSNDAS